MILFFLSLRGGSDVVILLFKNGELPYNNAGVQKRVKSREERLPWILRLSIIDKKGEGNGRK